MNVLIMVIITCSIIYTFSYARYNWKKKNWAGVAGTLILALAAFLLPLFLLVTDR